MARKKWECDWCHEKFKLKRDLVEHLEVELDDASHQEMSAYYQLEDLGIDPYRGK